jgi:hypothetical protein
MKIGSTIHTSLSNLKSTYLPQIAFHLCFKQLLDYIIKVNELWYCEDFEQNISFSNRHLIIAKHKIMWRPSSEQQFPNSSTLWRTKCSFVSHGTQNHILFYVCMRMRQQLSSSVHINIAVFWDITPRSLVLEERRHFRRNPPSPSSSFVH